VLMDVRFSELFAPGKDSLAIYYSFMFPRDPEDDPCPARSARRRPRSSASGETALPSCVGLLDQLYGMVEARRPHVSFGRVGPGRRSLDGC